MTRVLVLGSAGMAGHVAALELANSGFNVLCLQRGPSELTLPCIYGDVLDVSWLRQVLQREQIDGVVNCVGILNRTANINPPLTVLTNSYLPRWLEQESSQRQIRLVHVSTDCVFSGREGNYEEASPPDAADLYGRSKLLGEVSDYGITLRTSIIGPELTTTGSGLLNWLLLQRGQIHGYTHTQWAGITTIELARFIRWALNNPETRGVRHVSNGQAISKHDLLHLIVDELDLPVTLSAVDGPRSDKSLQRSPLSSMPEVPSYREMIKVMASWMCAHPGLYRHYFGPS